MSFDASAPVSGGPHRQLSACEICERTYARGWPIAGSLAVKPGEDLEGPIINGLMANVCFSRGWIVDTALCRGRPRRCSCGSRRVEERANFQNGEVWAVEYILQTSLGIVRAFREALEHYLADKFHRSTTDYN
jgi:hypothetical protein